MHKSADAQWRGRRLAAVLFELDGTLLDSLAELPALLQIRLPLTERC